MKMSKPNVKSYMSLQYPIRVDPIPEELGGGWVAYIPTLGEKIFRATGDTPEDAISDLEELKEVYFEQMLERGRRVPPPPPPRKHEYSGQVLVRMPIRLHAALAELAQDEGVSLNSLVTSLLSHGVARESMLVQMKREAPLVRLQGAAGFWEGQHPYTFEMLEPSDWWADYLSRVSSLVLPWVSGITEEPRLGGPISSRSNEPDEHSRGGGVKIGI